MTETSPTVADQETYKSVELYGGACQIDIPERYLDMSDFRQVPDHQEVFACGAQTDQSIIVEIVEMDAAINDERIANFHFEELAQANQATNTSIFRTEIIPDQIIPHFANRFKAYCVGEQQVSKLRDTARNVVNVYLFVLRLPQQESEVLITLNDPVFIDPESSSARVAHAVGQADVDKSMLLFRHVVQSFQIKDYGLFG